MRFTPTLYYGFFDYGEKPIFHVVCIRPGSAKSIHDWIGQRNIRFVDMLCIDDFILGYLDCEIDWSKVQK